MYKVVCIINNVCFIVIFARVKWRYVIGFKINYLLFKISLKRPVFFSEIWFFFS